ncbi:Predicted membrane protein [Staphylococcus petrasii]|uniref:Predicted membrane protein n=1 Tax=Staphylococcus petrasii TaxID=1276936 RepID=A0A380FVQ3_9STAP|nr:zinc ribbon domain-containing protein [Staphylococcus petrasii]PNZ32171.1 zinc ribbon domain-containing protein [Staphylococcus petrasii]TGE12116.1 zinc ribbon domain-containing protein [Staphylococcus petrasii]TGE15870.1 zinc ribbon domain-containing protein [Staphylococcus petrasii]SUM42592.1 Predicted membrane protein [Staphylococcus petrasii]
MKYCPNCGNPINEKQSFCNKCGKKLDNHKENNSTEHYRHEQYEPERVNRTHSNRNDSYNYSQDSSRKGSPIGKIALIIFIVLVVGLLLYGLYYAYNQFIGNNDNQTNTTQQETNTTHQEGDNQSNESHGPRIDVFSDNFDKQYIKSPSKDGYAGVYKGMTKSAVEDKYGKSDGSIFFDGDTYYKYGDIAALYDNNDEVTSVVVAPNHVSEQDFINVYNEPDDREDGNLIYDAYKDNDFSVIVIIKNGEVLAIKNIDQLP